MAGQALYRKWRSQTFEEVVGQEHVTLTLRNALRDGRMSHAYLFTGPRGTGKTSTARILAKAFNCLDEDIAARPCNQCRICTAIGEGRLLDLIEIDAASNRGIDEIRELREKIGFRPNEARYKVYIVDEVHMLTKEAFNALLKTLEEPPAHAVFVLATTEPDRVPETVRSRCQRFDFRRVPVRRVAEHLETILKAENGRANPEALLAIARRSTGSMRDAISLLDQLLSYGDEVLELARVEDVLGLVDGHAIGELVECIAGHDAGAGPKLINNTVANGVDLGQLVDQVLVYLRAVLFVQVSHSADLLEMPDDLATAVQRQAGTLSSGVVLNAIREFTEARAALRDQIPGAPQLPIELALVRSTLRPGALAPATVGTTPHTERVEGSTAAAAPPGQPVTPPAEATPQPVGKPAIPEQVSKGPEGVLAGPQAATASGQPGEASADLLAAAQEQWDRFLAAAGKRCGTKVQAALRSVRELDAAEHTIILRFAYPIIRDMVNQPEPLSQLEALWTELLGRPVGVRCAMLGESVVIRGATQSNPSAGSGRRNSDDEVLLGDARKMGAVVKRLDPPS